MWLTKVPCSRAVSLTRKPSNPHSTVMNRSWALLGMALFLLFPGWSFARQVDSSEGGITIYREEHSVGNHRGFAYWVDNENDAPVWFNIVLANDQNVYDGLAKGRLYIFPHQTVYVGTVLQRELHQPYRWSYRWEITPAEEQPGKPKAQPRKEDIRQEAQKYLQPAEPTEIPSTRSP